MSLDILVKEAQGLPEELIMNAVTYLRFLKFTMENAKPQTLPEKKKKRKAGLLKGLIKISDDFDEPLDDFEEYM